MTDRFPVFADQRGTLLPVELHEVPFPVARVFVVHGSASGQPRGNHVVSCEELAVLLSGAARFEVRTSSGECRVVPLSSPGERLCLRPGEHVVYHLEGEGSSILVLASVPYDGGSST